MDFLFCKLINANHPMDLKQHGAYFVLCHEKGHKIEVVVLNRVCILGLFSPKRGKGSKGFQRLPFTQIDQQKESSHSLSGVKLALLQLIAQRQVSFVKSLYGYH